MSERGKIAVVTVAYDSEKVLGKNIASLDAQQRRPDTIVVVDTGSQDTRYVEALADRPDTIVKLAPGAGFCGGNNAGAVGLLDDHRYVLFLNPDAMLGEGFLGACETLMDQTANARIGAMTGTLLHYDLEADQPSGRIDSTGIFRRWYGRWYDRGQGEEAEKVLAGLEPQDVPAICGALMFVRSVAMQQCLLRGREIWDESLFMWKDDIELSLRLRSAGWRLRQEPSLSAWHCRGWHADRSRMARHHRLLASRNEVRLYRRHRSPYIFYAMLKYAYVSLLER